jgi:phosphatidylglycerophosphate synthase
MEHTISEATKRISVDRKRTNLFKVPEQFMLAHLCRLMPEWVSPNMLTTIGMVGSFIVFAGFILGKEDTSWLALSIFGFAVQWFGDSLDGRIAYYRNIPRKWYGFSLDMSMDWLATIIIGVGFYFFLEENIRVLAFTFVTAYGWTMIIALMKYRITGNYEIDAGVFGPTELRVAICLVLLSGIFWKETLTVFAIVVNIVLYIINIVDFNKLLRLANERDESERAHK